MNLSRRSLLGLIGAGAASAVLPFGAEAEAQASMPSAAAIEQKLSAKPRIAQTRRYTLPQLKTNPTIRRQAPSIDIQAINFRTGSSAIDRSEMWKVERIGTAMGNIIARNPDELFLIEGHTDAVGSRASNQLLSDRRALSLAATLQRYYGIPSYALSPAGYGEDFLLVPTQAAEWRNRRVTIRRITDFIQ